MADTTTGTTRVTQVATVIVGVADQDAALAFFTDVVGFEAVADFRYGEEDRERWVEVAPPGAATRVSLARRTAGVGVETGVVFVSGDLEADHAALRARGVDVDDALLRAGDPIVRWAGAALAGIPTMFRFRDPDGNSYLMVQQV
jgi:catechol 2,3-dioxygenase-like lactoylglutathione lyase family enzyme